MTIYRVQDDLFSEVRGMEYGDYDYTDRNPKKSSENAWFWTSIVGRGRGNY